MFQLRYIYNTYWKYKCTGTIVFVNTLTPWGRALLEAKSHSSSFVITILNFKAHSFMDFFKLQYLIRFLSVLNHAFGFLIKHCRLRDM
jgi:hypothetical protein